jgi:hypothetical protein
MTKENLMTRIIQCQRPYRLVFLNYFLTRKHLAKGFFFEKNLPKLNLKVGVSSFFRCKRFRYCFLRMFLLDLISMDSIVHWYHSFYPLSSSFSRKKDPTPPSFLTANTNSSSNDPPLMPWIDVGQPPHGTAMHWQYLRMISL